MLSAAVDPVIRIEVLEHQVAGAPGSSERRIATTRRGGHDIT
jgi:hypothetical protein